MQATKPVYQMVKPSSKGVRARTDPFATELMFTEVYQQYQNAPAALREIMCLRAQYPDMLCDITDDDLFAGRVYPNLVGFSPDEWGRTAFGYYHLPAEIQQRLAVAEVDERYRQRVREMVAFWDKESTSAKLRRAYPPEMAKWLPSDDWMNEFGVAFPLYRLTGGNVNVEKLLALGIPGLRAELRQRRRQADETNGDIVLFEAMEMALDLLVGICQYYEAGARAQAMHAPVERQHELIQMANVLARIAVIKPETLREAIQLFWLYNLMGDVRNHGRMDVYLGDFLAADLDSGRLTEDEALRLVQGLWRLMAARNTRVHNRVIVGGLGRSNEANADRFALLAMEASRTVLEIEPQLSLRFYQGMNPALMTKALDVLGEGRTYPILYNDNVNVPAVEKALRVDRAEAEQYVPFGCGEYIIDHKSFGTPSGVINLLKALEVTLRNGRDPLSGRQIGLALGHLEDFATFDDLWTAYRQQVEHFVTLLADQEMLEYRIAGEEAAYLYQSMLYDDCLARGKALFSGGIRYLGGTIETYGNSSTADSLTAIKELVYEKKVLTKADLLAALDANFEGYAKIRRLLLDERKYGNDDPVADQMVLDVHNHVCNFVREQADRVGLHSYLVVIINNSANTLMGRQTAASADGRLSGKSMNNGNAPAGGADHKGITAMFNSIVKPDPSIHAGAVQNMKMSPELFTAKRPELEALLGTYFDKGGAQAMITVVRRGDLEQALREPEQYRHIFVRVGGFSARFVDLSRDVQEDILSRTLY